MHNQFYYFRINLSAQQCLSYYRGSVSSIQVRAECGRSVRFAAKHIVPYISKLGVSGRFRLTISADNRFIGLDRVAS